MEQGHAPLDISLLIQKRSNYTDTHTPTKGQPLLSKRVSIGYLKELKEAQRFTTALSPAITVRDDAPLGHRHSRIRWHVLRGDR